MKAALRDLRQAHGADWPVVDALASWYLYLLRKSRKPSTIRTYHSTVGRRLLLVFADEDPMSCDPAVLGLRYEQVLRLSLAKNLQYATGRLAQFARHAERILGWPAAEIADLCDGGDAAGRFVRAALPPLASLPEVFAEIARIEGVGRLEAEAAAVAVAVAAYSGMRIDEALGLTVADLLDTLDVHVHCTPVRGLKSGAARRIVPLGLFAPEAVRTQIETHLARRRRIGGDPTTTLLFAPTSEPGGGIDATLVRRALRATFGDMLGLPVLPHDLRHGFLSVVQLLLYVGPAGAKEITALTGWNSAEQDLIRHQIAGPAGDPLRLDGRLSALAGHAGAEQTTIPTYCHLNDMALGILIREARERLPAKVAARMLRMNAATVQPLCDADGTVRLEDLRALVVMDLRFHRIKRRLPSDRPDREGAFTEDPLTPALVHRLLTHLQAGSRPKRWPAIWPARRSRSRLFKHMQRR